MGWNDEEQGKQKKGMNLSSKILLALIFCILLIIIILFVLLMNIQGTSFKILVDGKASVVSKEQLLSTVDNITYVNIEEFAKLVGYEYHLGEYKAYVTEKDKCYVQRDEETASFYLNDNKVYKLSMGELEKEYEEYVVDNKNKSINDKIYAPVDAISKAFNVVVDETANSFEIYTLDYLVTLYDERVVSWGYTSILEEDFENKKALLYGLIVVRKEGGLYKIINIDNTKEIALDRYTSIVFSENMQEFYVTNNSTKKVGVINLDGTTKIDSIYESISLFDKQSDLYLVKQQSKYGIVKGGNITVVFPEYDKIGTSIEDKEVSLMLDTLIPVCKGEKWGAYTKEGRMILPIQYDGFGYTSNTITIDGIKKSVQPLLSIQRCEGIVVKVKKDEEFKYGLINTKGEELVPAEVDAIYELPVVEDEDSKYFMLYNEKEINVIERLMREGYIEGTVKEEEDDNIIDNSTGNTIENTTITNAIENTNSNVDLLNNIINNSISGNLNNN